MKKIFFISIAIVLLSTTHVFAKSGNAYLSIIDLNFDIDFNFDIDINIDSDSSSSDSDYTSSPTGSCISTC